MRILIILLICIIIFINFYHIVLIDVKLRTLHSIVRPYFIIRVLVLEIPFIRFCINGSHLIHLGRPYISKGRCVILIRRQSLNLPVNIGRGWSLSPLNHLRNQWLNVFSIVVLFYVNLLLSLLRKELGLYLCALWPHLSRFLQSLGLLLESKQVLWRRRRY